MRYKIGNKAAECDEKIMNILGEVGEGWIGYANGCSSGIESKANSLKFFHRNSLVKTKNLLCRSFEWARFWL